MEYIKGVCVCVCVCMCVLGGPGAEPRQVKSVTCYNRVDERERERERERDLKWVTTSEHIRVVGRSHSGTP